MCTRVTYLGDDNFVVTGRSMEWGEDLQSDLWIFPAGVSRNGMCGAGSLEWTSKYGSVIASGYNIASGDGLNEKGLCANLLYLAEANYGSLNGKPPMSITLWVQYALDNYATVAEAVAGLQAEPFRVKSPILPNGRPASMHLSLSDPSGDSAIFEYVDGNLVIHHGREYQVMTNSPVFDQQLALDAYWRQIGGNVFLPGTISAADRFARASYFVSVIPKTIDKNYITAVPEQKMQYQAVASVLGIMRAIGVPLGITTPDKPNISSTLWRTVTDHQNMIYYFDSATTPNTFWVDLKDVDFSKGAPVKKLAIAGGKYYAGNTASQFVAAEPFAFGPA
ncbi:MULTISPECIES: linear amide C-N hydrolase [unclassified Polynucleobacter]|jgi:choloylglycine hydrolase|uniref:linear amide C-N hydrolase n=1 Tax=unclassified Polynucleobacter TaxID=2640945 RepID=UPI000BCDF6A8|nr:MULTISPECIES: linear amide C-N hydrolase [unclassified Polynucleobacter]OYY21020.1 MAG: hydrolase [Polynucleobacter sp. 35-46-11]OZA77725.1 MAG: hydrolase [Polynucleobacter sp. 39-46-10]